MQPLISLSTTEAEYISFFEALHKFISVNNLLSEIQSQNFPIPNNVPRVICKVFEDNKVAFILQKITRHEHVPNTYKLGCINSDKIL